MLCVETFEKTKIAILQTRASLFQDDCLQYRIISYNFYFIRILICLQIIIHPQIKKTVVDTLKRANTELTTPSFCDPIVNFRQTDKHIGMHDDEKDKPAAISSYGISVKEGNKINGSKPKHLVMVNHQGGQEAVKKSSKKRSYRNVDVKNTPSSPSPKKKTSKSKSNSKSLKAVFVPSSSLSNHNTNNTFASKLEKTMQKGSDESLIFAHYMSSMYDSKMKESIDSTMEGSNHHHSLITNNSDHSLLPSFYSSERDYIGFATDNGSIHDYSYTRSSMNISSDDNNKNPKEYLPRLFSDAFSSYEQTQGTLCDQNTHINDNFHKADDTALNPDCKSDKVLEHTESHVNSLLIDSPRTSCNNLPFHSGDTNIRIHSSADNLSAQLSPNQYHCEIPGDHIMMARPQTATLADIDASAMSAYTKLLCDDRACGNINPDEDIMAMDVRKDGVVMKEDSLDCQRSSMAKIARCLYYDDEGGYETKVNHFVSVQRPIPKRSGPPRPIVQENCSDAEKNLNGVVDELYLLGNSNLN